MRSRNWFLDLLSETVCVCEFANWNSFAPEKGKDGKFVRMGLENNPHRLPVVIMPRISRVN